MKESIKDAKLVEEAGFTATVTLVAHTSIASLRYLRDLAKRLGISMENLKPQDIIEDLKPSDALTRKFNSQSRERKSNRSLQLATYIVAPERVVSNTTFDK